MAVPGPTLARLPLPLAWPPRICRDGGLGDYAYYKLFFLFFKEIFLGVAFDFKNFLDLQSQDSEKTCFFSVDGL
jgi:hypothetical protein